MPEKREKRNIARTEIINYMLNHSVTSKAELAKELGLSMPTVLTNVNELIAKGLNSELMLIPNEKKRQILAILNEDKDNQPEIQSLIDNPWQGLLGDDA